MVLGSTPQSNFLKSLRWEMSCSGLFRNAAEVRK